MKFLFRLQEARLEVLQTILREREENHAELNTKRLDKLWTKKQKEREKKVNWIRKEHIKCKWFFLMQKKVEMENSSFLVRSFTSKQIII